MKSFQPKSEYECDEAFFKKMWTQENGSIYVVMEKGDEAGIIKKAILLAKKQKCVVRFSLDGIITKVNQNSSIPLVLNKWLKELNRRGIYTHWID